ncbi:MAG: hypothetical protein IKT39_04830 [Clostridia bacterium]|nr:hypothetical protein [Clostridia bacterium]
MGSDMEKALGMLMTMLSGKEDVKQEEEELNEISSDEQEETLNSDGLENMLGAFSGDDKRVTLLSSIKPYMSEKRKGKIDTAINMVRILSFSSGLGINLFDR